ncbi:hypothetical protein AM493_08220 [Flavobacterium akiainvivens]|uniref:Response regulatory domain-containing protein n=1 Tax=Flavobacterium akiainvivens TaxID=1202724 RepID=A0A0M8M905_9FLAO|nr:response regulator [Flavobacterium akiainvivens]KOS06023.1 hypothetical protein AM493_08220 [Flavobacterium akiainvivens]
MLYSKKIFLVEDDYDDIHFFQEALLQLPDTFQITIFHSGEELLKTFERYEGVLPDVIFLDSSLPLFNGMEILAQIKALPTYNAIPVIVMSVSDYPIYIDKAYTLGAHFYYIKPYNFATLKGHLHKLLSINWQDYTHPTHRDNFLIY